MERRALTFVKLGILFLFLDFHVGRVNLLPTFVGMLFLNADELVEKKFEGSLPSFIAAFTRHGKMSGQEIDEVQRMIDEFRKGGAQ